MDETASSNPILQRIDDRGVAYITLNRPEVYNGYNGEMIAALLAAFDKLAHEPLRVAVIKGSGRNFQAGADINWLENVRLSAYRIDVGPAQYQRSSLAPEVRTRFNRPSASEVSDQ